MVEEGDHITYLNVFNAFILNKKSPKWCHRHYLNFQSLSRAVSVRNQLEKYLNRFNIPIRSSKGDTVSIRKCILTGHFHHAAKLLPNGSYSTVRENEILYIHPSSVLFNRSPKYVVFNEGMVFIINIYIADASVKLFKRIKLGFEMSQQ